MTKHADMEAGRQALVTWVDENGDVDLEAARQYAARLTADYEPRTARLVTQLCDEVERRRPGRPPERPYEPNTRRKR